VVLPSSVAAAHRRAQLARDLGETAGPSRDSHGSDLALQRAVSHPRGGASPAEPAGQPASSTALSTGPAGRTSIPRHVARRLPATAHRPAARARRRGRRRSRSLPGCARQGRAAARGAGPRCGARRASSDLARQGAPPPSTGR